MCKNTSKKCKTYSNNSHCNSSCWSRIHYLLTLSAHNTIWLLTCNTLCRPVTKEAILRTSHTPLNHSLWEILQKESRIAKNTLSILNCVTIIHASSIDHLWTTVALSARCRCTWHTVDSTWNTLWSSTWNLSWISSWICCVWCCWGWCCCIWKDVTWCVDREIFNILYN